MLPKNNPKLTKILKYGNVLFKTTGWIIYQKKQKTKQVITGYKTIEYKNDKINLDVRVSRCDNNHTSLKNHNISKQLNNNIKAHMMNNREEFRINKTRISYQHKHNGLLQCITFSNY